MSAGSGVKIVLTAHGASERGIEVVPEGTKEKKGSKRYDEERGEADDDSMPDGGQSQAKGASKGRDRGSDA